MRLTSGVPSRTASLSGMAICIVDSNILSLIVRLFLSLVFLAAGVTKLLQMEEWRQNLSQYGLPWFLLDSAKYTIPALEIGTGLGMLLPVWSWASYFALCLLSLFTAGVVLNLLQHRRVTCGCFGQFWRKEAGRAMIARNSLLILVAASLAFWL